MLRTSILIAACLLAGCGPHVPEVADPHHIVIDGVPMTQAEFLTRYCIGVYANRTCDTVSRAAQIDALAPKQPNGW